MPLLHNRAEYNDLRRKLRSNATKAEILLWLRQKQRGCHGYKFRRQHGVGRYILDLYCPRLKLAVEVDGRQHFTPGAQAYDRERDAWLAAVGIQVVRFTTFDVIKYTDHVMEALSDIVAQRAAMFHHPAPTTSESGHPS